MLNRFITIPLIFTCSILAAQDYVPAEEGGSLTVNGDSSLHKWHATTETVKGELTMTDGMPSAISVTVPVETLKSGKKGLDKKMYKAMETGDHTDVTFKLTGAAVPKEIPEGMEGKVVELTGDLTVLKATKSISFLVTITEEEGKLTLEGSKTFDMTDYKVKPPTAMLGAIKTDPEIKVEFTWVLQPKKAEK